MIDSHEPRDEQRNELVARELVHDSVPDVDDGGRFRVEACHEAAELLWTDRLGQRGRAAHVREEECRFDLCAARPFLERVNAPAADASVDAGRAESKEAQDVARPPEWGVAELAARIRGNRAADPPDRRVPAEMPTSFSGENAAPFLLRGDPCPALERLPASWSFPMIREPGEREAGRAL